MDEMIASIAVLPPTGFRRRPLARQPVETEDLAALIDRAVRRETDGNVRDLQVEVGRTRVVLTGRCHTFYTKQKAQHAAMGVAGPRQLVNRIEVA